MDIGKEIKTREERIARMIDYMKLKIDESDFHGVADAAMDVRELVAEIDILKRVTNERL